MTSRLQRYYQDIRHRFVGRCEMHERTEAALTAEGDLLHACVACMRKKLYQAVLDDIFYFMPKFELPWRAATKEYRRRLRQSHGAVERLERELRNAYEKIDAK